MDGFNRTENSEPYNYPAVSNGQNWNPGVGIHNITGELYSENSLGGMVCDEISLQITIVDCNSNSATEVRTCSLLDHGISDKHPNEERLVWLDIDGQGIKEYSVTGSSTVVEYSDGSALMSGTVEQVDNTCNKWEYSVRLMNKRNWTQWSALGRSFKPNNKVAADHTTWDYYELDNNNSTFTGRNCLSGQSLTITHNCLLYTSPSPRDATLSRMPSSA